MRRIKDPQDPSNRGKLWILHPTKWILRQHEEQENETQKWEDDKKRRDN